jgi:hypothetical protein
MFQAALSDISSDSLIRRHGRDAPRVLDVMIDLAIREGRHDEALELDRVRRRVKLILAA